MQFSEHVYLYRKESLSDFCVSLFLFDLTYYA